ncbi:hypothetical protein TPA0907_55630 [Micromonospora humidisoli]|uniref:hypothetical protein n=1 Tax=Micromonospora sp. AKA109 TaxID=2733865 RepID=UPI0022C5C2BF|nr:hypothetical protein [Micromonospora sp. AKA109]GHJ11196.1 hypothetical protein TPA0907_55630 [Micromonospora sp. AKA109]
MHIEPRVTEYTVCPLPEGDINASGFTITVAYRGRDLWAVLRHRWCLGTDGEGDYESVPSEREDEWLAGHRFALDDALQLAAEHVLKLTVNGWTVADALAAAERRSTR